MSEDEKESFSKKILDAINEITRMRESYEEEKKIFDEINDKIQSLFECDLECTTCSPEDRAKCMQNFRVANIFLQKETRYVIHVFNEYLNVFNEIIVKLVKSLENKKEVKFNYFS
ncbi:MAG: hypothetical protein ACTSYF_08740 [Promethearchaeota archaeon]